MSQHDPGALREIFNQTLAVMAIFGAAGGATLALANRMKPREALRQIVIGTMIASGLGVLSPYVIAYFIDGFPAELGAAVGVIAGSSYLVGVFGSAALELALAKIEARKRRAQGGTDEA